MKSQIEVYRAKAKEYARLTILTKSLRAGGVSAVFNSLGDVLGLKPIAQRARAHHGAIVHR